MKKFTRHILFLMILAFCVFGILSTADAKRWWMVDGFISDATTATSRYVTAIHSGNSNLQTGDYAIFYDQDGAESGVTPVYFLVYSNTSGVTGTNNSSTHPYTFVPDNDPASGLWKEGRIGFQYDSGASNFLLATGSASGNTAFAVALSTGENLAKITGNGDFILGSRTTLTDVSTFDYSAFLTNAYYSGGWKYLATDKAAGILLDADTGTIYFYTDATGGVAGGAISWTTAASFVPAGNLNIGGKGIQFGDNTGVMIGAWSNAYSIGVSSSQLYFLTSALGKFSFYNGTVADANRYLELGNSGASAFAFGSGSATGNTPFAVGLATGENFFRIAGDGDIIMGSSSDHAYGVTIRNSSGMAIRETDDGANAVAFSAGAGSGAIYAMNAGTYGIALKGSSAAVEWAAGVTLFVSATDNKLYFTSSDGVDHALY